MNKRLLSMFLALCMIVSMLPVTALAEEIHTTIGGSGEVISFAPLTETAKTVSLGTSIEDLELPETLTATVRTAVPAAENPTQDSGSPETASPTTATEPEWEETTVDVPVRWVSPDYDMNTEGEYIFTSEIEGYTVSAPLPELTVTVGEMPLTAVAMPLGVGAQTEIANFADLQSAINGAASDLDLMLSDNCTSTESLTIASGNNYNITIDLNGKTLQSTGQFAAAIKHSGAGNLIIEDSSSGGIIASSNALSMEGTIVVDGGSLEVNGGKVKSGSLSAAIRNNGNGTIVVSGGAVEAVNDLIGIENTSTGTVNILGGTVSTAYGSAILNNSTGTINISGGTVSATDSSGRAIKNDSTGKINISGTANITSPNTRYDGGTIYLGGSSSTDIVFEMTGGKVENTGSNGTAVFNYQMCGIKLSGGIVEATGSAGKAIKNYLGTSGGKIVISGDAVEIKGGGNVMNKAPDLSGYTNVKITASTTAADGSATSEIAKTDIDTDAKVQAYKYIKIEPGAASTDVAQIGETGYATLKQAVDSATEGQTIKLVADITITAAIEVNTTRSFTLDLNGHSISCSNAVNTIVKAGEGTLTITDSQENGAIVGNTGVGASTVRVLAGTLIINGGTIRQSSASNKVVHNGDSSETQCGTVEIRGGTINGTVSNAGNLIITDGTIDGGAGVAIYNHKIASVSGGTITSNSIITLSNTADASLTITGGTISNSCTTGSYGAIFNMSEVFISGGTIDGSGSGRKGISNYNTTSKVTIYVPSAGKSIVIKGDAKVIDSFGTFTVPSSGATITGSTNYDGTTAETYNAANLGNYKYIKVEPAADVSEQFNLTPGGTYYFDLSGEKSNVGTVNTALPDTTLHYVPFTYAGTVNAYSLTSAMATTEEYATANKSDRSLFVGDFVIDKAIRWNALDTANLIFGKTFDTNYKLRSLSAGSSKTGSASDGSDHIGQPSTNEWNQILTKSGSTDDTTGWIKNWSERHSYAQDTSAALSSSCAIRGYDSACHWGTLQASDLAAHVGFRPALEVLNPATLTADGLKAVTLNLNGGGLKGVGANINIICAGDSFKAPSGEGLTAPVGKVFDGWNDTSGTTTYAVGATVPSTVTGLTARWGNPMLQNTTTNKKYASLQAAVNEVAEGQTIQLLGGIALTASVTISSSVSFSLDLNGYTLNGVAHTAIVHSGSGTLTIVDSGSDGKLASAAHSTIELKGGSLLIRSGNIANSSEPSFDTYAILNSGSGSVSVLGGFVRANQYAIYNKENGDIVVENGTLISVTKPAIQNQKIGKITIKEGAWIKSSVIGGATGTIHLANGTNDDTVLVITGGKIENPDAGNAIYNDANGKIAIPSGSPVIRGGNMAMNKAPDLSSYANVAVTASSNYDGSSPTAYNAADISSYKYLMFAVNSAGAEITTAATVSSVSHGQITINAAVASSNPGGQAIEYAISTNGSTAPDSGWQPGLDFTGLTPSVTYYVWARTAAKTGYNAGTAAASAAITTTVAPVNASISPTSVTYDLNPKVNGHDGFDISLTSETHTLTAVKSGETPLSKIFDYSVDESLYHFTYQYLKNLPIGLTTITFDMSGGISPTLALTIEDTRIELTSVAIDNTAPTFGDTLSATINPSGAAVFYVWRADGILVGTGATYEVKAADIGKIITLTVTGNENNGYKGTVTSTATFSVEKANSPSAPVVTFSFDGTNTNKLMDVSPLMEYSLDGGSNWTDCSTNMDLTAGLDSITAANDIKVRVKETATHHAGAIQTIDITQPSVPTIGKTDETSARNNGTITGVNNLMEYKKSSDTSYTAISGGTVTDLAPGVYHVRIKSTGTALASPDATVTIMAFVKTTPTAADLIYALTAVNYDGTAKPVSVTADSGKALGVITVKYDGSTTAPTDAGTYAITVDIAGNAVYNAVTGLSLGSYTIHKITYTGANTVSASVFTSGQTGATVTLPDLPIGGVYGTPVAGGTITMTGMSIAETTLTYTAPASTAGQSGTITIPVTGATNYNNYNIVVTVTSTAKTPQVISYATATIAKTYGNAKFTNPLTQITVNGLVTYASDDISVATVNPATGEVTIVAVGDGSATITATAAETSTHAQATASYTVTVAKKALTLKAENKSMTKGDGLPTFTYTSTGLVNGDAVTTAPTMFTTADGTSVGTFDITITGGVVTNAASYDITHTKGALTVAERLFTVTVTNGTGSGSYADGATVTITANNRSGYTFTGWSGADVTFADASQKTTTFTMPAKAVTVSANYRQNNSGGNGGGSDGGSSSNDNNSSPIVTPPAPDKPNSPTQGEIKISGKVDKKGNVTVKITDKAVADAFDKALAEAKQNGSEKNGITVVLHVDTGNKTGSHVTVNLPKTVQDTIIEKKIVNTIVVVDNPDIRIGMDLATVQEINKQAKSDVNITATRMDGGKLTGKAKKAIGSRPVFDLKVNYGKGKSVQNFGTGSVSVTIPYTLGAKEKAGNVQAVYVDAKGKVHWLVNSVYDRTEKVLRFSTSHFSTYGIGYNQTNTAFKDIADHWAKEEIEFAASRGLLSGTSTTAFSPNSAMTRGMFVTALGRLAKADVSSYTKSSFIDVKSGAYYMGYIEWASKNNIVTGTGNGTFAPDQSITREQMAVIMLNYAKATGFILPKVYMEHTFADSTKISAYAKEAVKQMQMAGVISGKSGNLFDSQGAATRAEASAVLFRFAKLTISNDTMQGWMRNDSGQWMYYESGKPVTGKKDIDGTAYTFDQYGVTADMPKNLK